MIPTAITKPAINATTIDAATATMALIGREAVLIVKIGCFSAGENSANHAATATRTGAPPITNFRNLLGVGLRC